MPASAENDGKLIMRIHVLWLLILLAGIPTFTSAAEDPDGEVVRIADPFIEIHTGPGQGYPIFTVAERGEEITILRRHTDWFEVRTRRGRKGWVHRKQLAQTLAPSGEKVQLATTTLEAFSERRWEIGATGGDFGGAAMLGLYGGYAFSKNLSAELGLAQSFGNISSTYSFTGRLVAQPFPEWRYSPFFSLGTGYIRINPKATIVYPERTTNQMSYIAIGLRTWLTRRFIFRIEYDYYTIFSATNDRDNNEELNGWQAGFAVFF